MELFDVEGNFVCFGEMCVVGCVTAVLFVGFQKELKDYGTGDLGRVVAAMNAKALVAGRVLLRRAKAESDKMLEGSAERLKLVTENDRLKKEIAILQNLNDLRKKQIEELEEKVRGQDIAIAEAQKELDLREETIEGLRQEIVKGIDSVKKAEGIAVQLLANCSKKDKLIEKLQEEAQENMQLLIDATDEINEKSDAIYEAYRDALATFGSEPEPLAKSEGLGVSGLLDWILQEFAVLGNILMNISDNSAVVSCGSAFALLEHEGCQDMSKIADAGYQFPESLELQACSSRIQSVEKAFLRRFWMSAGRQVLRDTARQRLEEVRVLSFGFVVFV